ncbi:MAG: esterase/lipase family protein [Candidatus Methylacidiphilales bacterium]
MKRPLIILHGWSDDSKSFRPLASWFRKQGFKTHDVFLGDYISMRDSIRLTDLGAALQRALKDKKVPTSRGAFDLVVHSTGGLVAREFLCQFCAGNPALSPIRHLLMLAPANFGSPLASLGKSMVGRLFKGWKWDGMFQTGTQVLEALELASPYSFDLAIRDLFDPQFPIYAPEYTQITVLTGTSPYPEPMKRLIHENGSDGTVRVSTANLNARHYHVDFADPTAPQMHSTSLNAPETAFAVLPLDHGSITRPADDPILAELILNSLRADTPAQYLKHVRHCQTVTEKTYLVGATSAEPKHFHPFMHVVFRVRDQHGDPVDDYFVEFYQQQGDRSDRVFEAIHKDILEKVTKNSRQPSYRSFLFDIKQLENLLQSRVSTRVEMSLVAADDSEWVGYRNPPDKPGAGIPIFSGGSNNFIHPNQPVLVDITLHRDPVPAVFKLTKV